MRADRILVNASVVTNDTRQPFATEVALRRGRILQAGSGLAADPRLSQGAHVIDCGGGTVIPGFIDAHLHFFALVDSLLSVDLGLRSRIRSIGALIEKLQGEASRLEPGEWLKGKGYSEFSLAEGRHPNRWDLDAACQNHPVKLTHRTHHAHVLNSLALAACGIDRYTPDPPGGLIDRDLVTCEPTGLLFEMGAVLADHIPKPDPAQLDRGAEQASGDLLSVGVTTFQDASQTNGSLRWKQLRRWKAEGLLRQRVSVLLGWEGFQEFVRWGQAAFPPAPGLKLGGLKIVLDRTTGDLYPSRRELTEMVREAHRRGWPVAVHAVEEETVEAAVEAFESLEPLSGSAAPARSRHRIEHCSVCPPPLLRRLAATRVSVVTQPSFLVFHGNRYLKTLAREQIQDLYPVGALASAGIRVAASSDCPIVPAHPLTGIAGAVTRRAESGTALAPDQRVDMDRALRMHTSDAAWILGMARRVGSIASGKRADLVVLSRNPFGTPADEVQEIETVMTIVDGDVVWSTSRV